MDPERMVREGKEMPEPRWWWLGSHGPSETEVLQALLTRIWRKETLLAGHLAERAHALRFAPDRVRLEEAAERETRNAHALTAEIDDGSALIAAAPASRPGALTATKLGLDLNEIDDLDALYWRACAVTSNPMLRDKLESLADGEAATSKTIRGILGRMDSYVTDRQ
jgi:hypothetical protein